MLNNSAGTLNAFGEDTHPHEVYNEVRNSRHEESIVIFSMPGIPKIDLWIEHLFPVPAYDVENNYWNLHEERGIVRFQFMTNNAIER